jgi:hypothetical protein
VIALFFLSTKASFNVFFPLIKKKEGEGKRGGTKGKKPQKEIKKKYQKTYLGIS